MSCSLLTSWKTLVLGVRWGVRVRNSKPARRTCYFTPLPYISYVRGAYYVVWNTIRHCSTSVSLIRWTYRECYYSHSVLFPFLVPYSLFLVMTIRMFEPVGWMDPGLTQFVSVMSEQRPQKKDLYSTRHPLSGTSLSPVLRIYSVLPEIPWEKPLGRKRGFTIQTICKFLILHLKCHTLSRSVDESKTVFKILRCWNPREWVFYLTLNTWVFHEMSVRESVFLFYF